MAIDGVQEGYWKYVPGGGHLNACPGGLEVITDACPGRMEQKTSVGRLNCPGGAFINIFSRGGMSHRHTFPGAFSISYTNLASSSVGPTIHTWMYYPGYTTVPYPEPDSHSCGWNTSPHVRGVCTWYFVHVHCTIYKH